MSVPSATSRDIEARDASVIPWEGLEHAIERDLLLPGSALPDPTSSTIERMTFRETRRSRARLGEGEQEAAGTTRPTEPVVLFSKSEFFRRPLPDEAISALVDVFSRDRTDGEARELDFMPWGGAYNREPSDAHRVRAPGGAVPAQARGGRRTGRLGKAMEAAHRQVVRSWASVHPWGSGRVFQNFADLELEDPAEAYYGSNLDRLAGITHRYDPDGVFHLERSPGSHDGRRATCSGGRRSAT